MDIIKPNVTLVHNDGLIETCLPIITKAARICYASSKKENEEALLRFLIKANHVSPFAHGIIYIPMVALNNLKIDRFETKVFNYCLRSKYTLIVDCYGSIIAVINCRTLLEGVMQNKTPQEDAYELFMNMLDFSEGLIYRTMQSDKEFRFVSVEIDTCLAVGRELERHIGNIFYYNEQSTRYCNFSKDKFGNSVKYCEPYWYAEAAQNNPEKTKAWQQDCINNETIYFRRLKDGWSLDEARKILSLETHTKIIITASMIAWNHFFDLRKNESTGKVDPDMLVTANMIYDTIN